MSEFLMLIQESLENLVNLTPNDNIDKMVRLSLNIVSDRKNLISSIDDAEDNRTLPRGVNKPIRQFVDESYRDLEKCDNMITDSGYELIIKNDLYHPDREIPTKDQAISIIQTIHNNRSSKG